MHDKLGRTFKCSITGFQGIATGRLEYLTGCNQLLLTPPVDKDGAHKDGQWIDEQRLELVPGANRITLDNGSTPGHGQAAPKNGP